MTSLHPRTSEKVTRRPVLRDESENRVMNLSESFVTNTSTPSAQHHQFGNSTTRATVLSLADKALLRRFSTEDSVEKPPLMNGPGTRPPMDETVVSVVFFVVGASSQGFVMDAVGRVTKESMDHRLAVSAQTP